MDRERLHFVLNPHTRRANAGPFGRIGDNRDSPCNVDHVPAESTTQSFFM